MSECVKSGETPIDLKQELGKQGEDEIARRLFWANFWGCRGKVLRNVYIPKSGGGTTEIDLLYLTRKGIFAIESKNFSGWIFGGEANRKWVASFYGGKDQQGRAKAKKEFFYNPIRQNSAHIEHLKEFLPFDVPAFSLIVFSQRCELKDIRYDDSKAVVCQHKGLIRCLRSIWKKNKKIFTKAQLLQLYEALQPLTGVSADVKAQHITDIKSHKSAEKTCPQCGGTLILRTAKSGEHAGEDFYGCSNYPRCKYIEPI